MKVSTLIILMVLVGCTSTMDNAQARLDASVVKATAEFKAAAKEVVADLPRQLTESTKAVIAAELDEIKKRLDRVQEKIVKILPPEDQEAFKKDIKEKGLFRAIKDWAVEIILGLLGLSGTAVGRGIIQKRRTKRAEAESQQQDIALKTFVKAIEKTDAVDVKKEIEKQLKEDHPDAEYEVRKLVSRAKSQIGKAV